MDLKFKLTFEFLILLLILGPQFSTALPQTIKIGGLFDIWDPYEETGFRHAVERMNADRVAFPLYDLAGQLEKIQMGDSYNASRKVCQLMKDGAGVGVIVGPQSPTCASHVHSVCEVLNVPHVQTKSDFRASSGNFLVNLYPHPPTLSMAYADMIKACGWSKIIVIYEDNDSLARLQGIFESTGSNIKELVLKQLPHGSNDYRPLMKELKKQYADTTSVIIDCQTSKLPQVFQDANSEGMMNHYYRYFITSLDIHTIKASDILFGDVNITAFRLMDPTTAKVQAVVESWKYRSAYASRNYFNEDPFASRYLGSKHGGYGVPILRNDMLKTETALMYDAMELITRALHASSDGGQPFRTESLDCDSSTIYPWAQGPLLMQNMKEVPFEGLTGKVLIDGDGQRRFFRLDIMELTQKNLTKIGVWDPTLPKKVNWTRTDLETQKVWMEDLKTAVMRVTMKESDPYCKKLPNGTLEGFSVDLIQRLSDELGFEFKNHLVLDNSYGSQVNDSRYKYGWDGLIGEILAGDADMAIGDMSITYDRGNAVDFTMPYMNLGISILYKKPVKVAPGLFSFLDPFHIDVWIYMATAYLGVSIVLFILARINPLEWAASSPGPEVDANEAVLENQFSLLNAHWVGLGSLMGAGSDILPKLTPYEWLNPHPCVDSPDELELTLHLTNSLWFTIGSLMQQGSDIAPKAGSTRMVAGIWWFFTLIMISSYTANLAAFLTKEGMEDGIQDIKDLPKQTKVKYGTIAAGSTRDFFKGATFPLYKEINKNMENMRPPPFVASTSEGVSRVNKSNGLYAFFMESISIEYQTERHCSFMQLGNLLDSKGYGIALKKGSKFRDSFNTKILELSENGALHDLKKKWWKERGGGKCEASKVASSSGAQALTLAHVGGVFVVLLGGCTMAFIMVFFEFMWKARKLARSDQESIWSEIWKELRFALQCQGETKPIKKAPSLSPTAKSESVPFLDYNGKEPIE